MYKDKRFKLAIRIALIFIFVATVFAPGGLTLTPAPAHAADASSQELVDGPPYYAYLPTIMHFIPFTGRVTYRGVAAANQTLKMYYTTNNWSTYSLYATTQTNANGEYVFSSPPAVGSGKEYEVEWVNMTNTVYLYAWVCKEVEGLSTDKKNCSFDIQDVVLTSPAHQAAINLPYTFRWNRRTTTSDIYEVRWWDTNLGHYMWTNPLPYASSFTLGFLPSPLITGYPYDWTVRVYGPNGFGVPYYYRWVTFNDRSSPPLEGVNSNSELFSSNESSGLPPSWFGLRSDMPQSHPAAEGIKPVLPH